MLVFVKEYLANASVDHVLAIKAEPLSLKEAAAHAVQQHHEAARRKQLTFQTVLEGNGALVQADAAALNQVLDNLLSNAVKFSPPGKSYGVRRQNAVATALFLRHPGASQSAVATAFCRRTP